ncbi:MAG TPA: hypothetical protein VHN15_01980 [Thermoanaerobaculia bacterium]|nr:hypothetical protein [Thermoanaerobaculia bacterium]
MRTACLVVLCCCLTGCASEPQAGLRSKMPAGPAPTPAAAPEGFEGTLDITEKEAPISPGSATLLEVRTAPHPGFDRIVFEFQDGPLPGYRVEYLAETAEQCGSGDEVRTEGGGQMLVRFHTAQAHTEDGKPSVAERERRPGLPVLKEAKLMCDFEGYVDWVLGVSTRKPYRVMELSEPPRLIVDVRY